MSTDIVVIKKGEYMKNTLLLLTVLNIIYFVVTAFINQHSTVGNFFLVPFGIPAIIAFILFFAGIISLIDENKRKASWLILILNGILMLFPVLVIAFI